AGADYVGLVEFIQKIDGGWSDVDVIIATPAVMPKIGRLGKILGPRNLMPNPKSGTVTNDVAGAVNEVKGGKIEFRVYKAGIMRAKPSTAKGTYLKGLSMASSMSPGISIDTKSFVH